LKNKYYIISIIAVIIMLAASMILAEPNSGEYNTQQSHAESRYIEESIPFFGLEIPDDVRKRFAALDTLPPPMLLSTQEYFDWRLMGGVPGKKSGAMWFLLGLRSDWSL